MTAAVARILLAGVVAGLLTACAGGTGRSTPAPATAPSGTVAADGRPVTFPASDGTLLDGRVFGSGEDGIVLAHMRPADQTSWFAFAKRLAADGRYQVLTFDFRGYGASEGDGFAVDVDVEAAIDHLAVEEGVFRVFVVGASMGGTGAIAGSAGHPDVAGVVTLSAPARFEGVDAVAAVSGLGAPLLLLVAEGDQPYADDARSIQAATDGAELVVLAGRRHGTDLFAEHGRALEDTIVGFFRDPT